MTKSHLLDDYSKQFVIAIYHLGRFIHFYFISLFFCVFLRFCWEWKSENQKNRSFFCFCWFHQPSLHIFHFYIVWRKGEKIIMLYYNTVTWAYHSTVYRAPCRAQSSIKMWDEIKNAPIFHSQLRRKISFLHVLPRIYCMQCVTRCLIILKLFYREVCCYIESC